MTSTASPEPSHNERAADCWAKILPLGATTVGVRAAAASGQALYRYLRDFYPIHPDPPPPADWTMHIRVGCPPKQWMLDECGVGYHAEPVRRHVEMCGPTQVAVQVAARKWIRAAFLAACEARQYIMLHASAALSPPSANGLRTLLIFAGERQSGKTTLALRLLLEHGWSLLSNDHLIMYETAGQLTVTSLPILIPVKAGTWVDLAHHLPVPYDEVGPSLRELSAVTPETRRDLDTAAWFTYRQLGQAHPLLTEVGPRVRLVTVLPSYGPGGMAVSGRWVTGEPIAAVRPHLRGDWYVAEGEAHSYLLDAPPRDASQIADDSARLLTRLTAAGPVLRWSHYGDPTPLLRWLAADAVPNRGVCHA